MSKCKGERVVNTRVKGQRTAMCLLSWDGGSLTGTKSGERKMPCSLSSFCLWPVLNTVVMAAQFLETDLKNQASRISNPKISTDNCWLLNEVHWSSSFFSSEGTKHFWSSRFCLFCQMIQDLLLLGFALFVNNFFTVCNTISWGKNLKGDKSVADRRKD